MPTGPTGRETDLAHDGEDVGLAVVVAVGANADVDLGRERIRLEARGEGKDGIRGREGRREERVG